MVPLKLFFVFFKIGLFAIGGAQSFYPLIEREVVKNNAWLTQEEFLDITGLTQIAPGAISIKFATYVGYKIAGIPGVFAANLGNFLPSFFALLILIAFYRIYGKNPKMQGSFQMIRIAVFSMLIAIAFQMTGFRIFASLKLSLLAVLFFGLFCFLKLHPAVIIIMAGLLGVVLK